MKYCRNCGKELADEAVLCTGCGCATEDFYSQSNKVPVQKSGEISMMALLGFIFSFISSLVGLILSCIAYRAAVNDNDEKSRTYAKAGIIISAILMGIGVVSVVIFGIVYGVIILAAISGPIIV